MDDEPRTEILNATYRALCEHGYADLSLRDIADESDLSKASIHYHFESKRDLFAAFLDHLFEEYAERVDAAVGETPREDLLTLLDALLADEDTPDTEFRTAILEMKAQAPYDDHVRARFAEFDELLYDRLRETIAAGVETGEFDESVQPVLAAEFLTTAVQGARMRGVTVGHPMDRFRETVTRYVETYLDGADGAEGTDEADAAEVAH